MKNKYKLLKELPGVEPGAIIIPIYEMYEGFMILDSRYEIPGSQYIFLKKQLDDLTDWFAPFLFKSNEGVDVYKGDLYWYILNNELFSNKFRNHTEEEHVFCFVNKENAEQCLETLKPKFKVGDIVVDTLNNSLHKINHILGDCLFYTAEKGINIKFAELATKEELIKYYEQQGWIKGATFKAGDGEYKVLKLQVYKSNEVLILTDHRRFDINDCQLIKGPNYPKRWENLSRDDQKSNSKVLPPQELAFLRLKDLHRVLIKEYNKNNNCDWKPDWNNPFATNWVVARILNSLEVADIHCFYHSLAFPNEELAEFALENWKELWEYYYELK